MAQYPSSHGLPWEFILHITTSFEFYKGNLPDAYAFQRRALERENIEAKNT